MRRSLAHQVPLPPAISPRSKPDCAASRPPEVSKFADTHDYADRAGSTIGSTCRDRRPGAARVDARAVRLPLYATAAVIVAGIVGIGATLRQQAHPAGAAGRSRMIKASDGIRPRCAAAERHRHRSDPRRFDLDKTPQPRQRGRQSQEQPVDRAQIDASSLRPQRQCASIRRRRQQMPRRPRKSRQQAPRGQQFPAAATWTPIAAEAPAWRHDAIAEGQDDRRASRWQLAEFHHASADGRARCPWNHTAAPGVHVHGMRRAQRRRRGAAADGRHGCRATPTICRRSAKPANARAAAARRQLGAAPCEADARRRADTGADETDAWRQRRRRRLLRPACRARQRGRSPCGSEPADSRDYRRELARSSAEIPSGEGRRNKTVYRVRVGGFARPRRRRSASS